MANKKKLKAKAREQAKTGNLSSKLVTRLEAAGVKQSNVNKIRNANQAGARAASSPQQQSQSQPQAQAKPLTGNPIKDGRYGIGAQKAAQKNYKALVEQGSTDAFNPGKPGSYKNSMADGFVGKKELNKYANRKDIDASKARRRLTSKGASFTAGANKLADGVFAKNNPLLAMMIGTGSNPYGVMSGGTGNKKRDLERSLYTGSSKYDYKNRLKDEVFTFRPNGEPVGRRPYPNADRLNSIFGNTDATTTNTNNTNTTNTNDTNTDNTNDTNTAVTPDEVVPETMSTDLGAGMMSGGGMGLMGATKLGRAKSRLQRLGILGKGTGLLGRGLQYGNALNA